MGMAVHTFNPGTQVENAGGSLHIELQDSQPGVHRETLSQKIITNKKAGCLAGVGGGEWRRGEGGGGGEKKEEEECPRPQKMFAVGALAVLSEG